MSDAVWKNIGPIANIPAQGARRLCLKHLGRPVAVFRTSQDEIFALIDECPHGKGPLSEGIVAGRTVTCPLHGWVIGLADGTAVAPDEGRAQSLSVRRVGEDIHVQLPAAVAAA
jgi:nitrite reductase (NADH) small subunit